MPYIADLHIHSRFSRACSPQLTIPNLAEAAKLKGIKLLGSGDFLHPLWLAELKRDLTELGNGLFGHNGTNFVLSCEVALIYSDKGRGRRIHLLTILPSFEDVEQLQSELGKRGGKLSSDGRPILGMSMTDYCKMVFNINPEAILIPAHIWTPWFGMFGSESGYDSLTDCFGPFSDKIYAIETGMSSDPAMNWRVGQLDNKSIVSFSDPHSLPKMGREATVFKGELSYQGLLNDLKLGNIGGTIEFYPEEGKYHFDGHRNCSYSQGPEKTRVLGSTCPVCGRGLTVGVLYRVHSLATRTEADLQLEKVNGWVKSRTLPSRPGYRMLVPLQEIIAETIGAGVSTQKVQNEYKKITISLGDEISILADKSIAEIAKIVGAKIAQAVEKARTGDIVIKPGFDGVYGEVKIWNKEDSEQDNSQISLF